MFARGTQEGKGDYHRLDGKTKPTQLCILNPRSHKSRRDGVYADYCRTATSGKSTTVRLLLLQPRCGWMWQHGPVILDSCIPARHKHPRYARTYWASDDGWSSPSDEIRRHAVAKAHHHSFQTPADTTFKFLSDTHYRWTWRMRREGISGCFSCTYFSSVRGFCYDPIHRFGTPIRACARYGRLSRFGSRLQICTEHGRYIPAQAMLGLFFFLARK